VDMAKKNKVLFFGQLKEKIATDTIEVEDILDTDELKKKIVEIYPILYNFKFIIALDKKMVQINQTIKDGQTIAIMPPFSGG
jgi:sulfur-carrier protein